MPIGLNIYLHVFLAVLTYSLYYLLDETTGDDYDDVFLCSICKAIQETAMANIIKYYRGLYWRSDAATFPRQINSTVTTKAI